MILGYGGLVSFGHGRVLRAIGGYGRGKSSPPHSIQRRLDPNGRSAYRGRPPCWAALIGALSLRTRAGLYFIMITLALRPACLLCQRGTRGLYGADDGPSTFKPQPGFPRPESTCRDKAVVLTWPLPLPCFGGTLWFCRPAFANFALRSGDSAGAKSRTNLRMSGRSAFPVLFRYRLAAFTLFRRLRRPSAGIPARQRGAPISRPP